MHHELCDMIPTTDNLRDEVTALDSLQVANGREYK